MDLGVFQPPFVSADASSGDDDNAAKHSTNMKWRLPPEESFSDWTVEIQEETHPTTAPENLKEIAPASEKRKIETVYHVHKAYLGTGPRNSLYFARVFQSQFSETSSQISTVSLPPKAAECFPDLLDFIYSEISDVKVDSPASAAAIRFLANYFGMEALFNNVNTAFIGSNLSNDTVIDYVHESIRYGDESLGNAASLHLVNSISNGSLPWTEALATLPLSSLLAIVAGTAEANQNLGRIIIEYIKSDVHRVSSENVATLLDRLCPEFVAQCPLDILQLVERYQLPANYPARWDCSSAIGITWFDQPYLRGFASAERSVYASLSDAQKVQILEQSLYNAHDDRAARLGSSTLEKTRLRQRAETLESELARFVRFNDDVIPSIGYEMQCAYDGQLYDPTGKMKPKGIPKGRPYTEEEGQVIRIGRSGTHFVGSRSPSLTNYPLYFYKGE
jgi:BTB/POZ domain